MRIVQGSNVAEASVDWRASLGVPSRRVVLDVGAGDGRWAYESARADPGSLFIGLDPDASALAEYAYRAGRKPSRGGVANVIYVAASIEEPPAEISAIADEVKVMFPWAALLRGLLHAERAVLNGLRSVARPGASFDFVLTYDAMHDHGAGLGDGAPSLTATLLEGQREPYLRHGIVLRTIAPLSRDEALAIPSTWGRRLLHGRPRDVFRVTAGLA